MKIWEISIVNAFGIDEQKVVIEGKNVKITGGTGTGKTSIIDSIDACFFGPKERVIRDATKPSRIIVVTEEYSFDRAIEQSESGKATSTKFVVRRGAVAVRGPQTFASRVVRSMTMRPLVFFDASPVERRAMLLRALPLEIDRTRVLMEALRSDGTIDIDKLIANGVDEAKIANSVNTPEDGDGPVLRVMRQLVRLPDIDWDAHAFDITKRLYEAAYDTRHSIGRDLDAKQNVVAGIRSLSKVPYDAPAHRHATATIEELRDLKLKLDTANKKSVQIDRDRALIQNAQDEGAKRITQLRDELADAEAAQSFRETQLEDFDAFRNEVSTQKAAIVSHAAAVDPDEHVGLDAKISKWQTAERHWAEAQATNEHVEKQTTAGIADVLQEIKILETKRADFDTATKFAEKELPGRLIADLALPIEGLQIEGDRILLNGKSIDVLSSGERMHFSMQLALALLSPLGDDDALKLICVDDLERLDPDLQAIVESYEADGSVQFIKAHVERGPLNVQAYDPVAER